MSQAIAGLTTPETDPYFYGWRYVRREQPDGTLTSVQQPLTAEDVLHPQEDDFIMQTDAHNEDCNYLKSALKAHLAERPHALVLSDCRVAWNHTGQYAHGPGCGPSSM